MAKRRSKPRQRPAERPVDHQAIANAIGGELGGSIDAPAGQITASQIAANMAAMQPPRAPVIQLLRNVGRYQMGETLRATPDQAEAQGLKPRDYREFKPGAGQNNQAGEADQAEAVRIEPAALLSARAMGGKDAEAAMRTQALNSQRRRARIDNPRTWQ